MYCSSVLYCTRRTRNVTLHHVSFMQKPRKTNVHLCLNVTIISHDMCSAISKWGGCSPACLCGPPTCGHRWRGRCRPATRSVLATLSRSARCTLRSSPVLLSDTRCTRQTPLSLSNRPADNSGFFCSFRIGNYRVCAFIILKFTLAFGFLLIRNQCDLPICNSLS